MFLSGTYGKNLYLQSIIIRGFFHPKYQHLHQSFFFDTFNVKCDLCVLMYTGSPHPVTKNACACVFGLDVSDEGNMLQFGEEE